MSRPKVSVVMSVYNGERYLSEAIESILQQTFTDFEFIIVDDGSTDGTGSILGNCTDSSIVHLRNRENIGLTRALNRGLEVASGEFVARQDVDDVSFPSRLARQVSYLEKNPSVGVLGTQMEMVDESKRVVRTYKAPCSHSLIVWASGIVRAGAASGRVR